MPALLIKISRRPLNLSLTSRAAASTLAGSVTSSCTLRIRGIGFPSWVASLAISSVRDLRSERAPTPIAAAPALANESAVARPMPFDAPEMKTQLPETSDLEESINGYVSVWIVEV